MRRETVENILSHLHLTSVQGLILNTASQVFGRILTYHPSFPNRFPNGGLNNPDFGDYPADLPDGIHFPVRFYLGPHRMITVTKSG